MELLVQGGLCIVLLCLLQHGTVASTTDLHPWGKVFKNEYCDYESFQSECIQGELTLIKSARYGHMSLGKCIQVDLGFLGCEADVMNILDSKCSGKRSCHLPVLDASLRETQPCTPGLALYLEVEYACVKRVPEVCLPLQATPDMSFVSSSQIFDANCHGRSVIDIHVRPGQQVKVTLVSLLRAAPGETYGLIVGEDGDAGVTITTSGNTVTELDALATEKVTVVLDPSYVRKKFLLGFKAVGCPAIDAPAGTSFDRNGNTATVSCLDSLQSWQLTCRGVHWLGVVGNCTKRETVAVVGEVKQTASRSEENLTLSKEVIFLIIGCATLLACVFAVTVGYVCLKRTQVMHRRKINGFNRRYDAKPTAIYVKQMPDLDCLLPVNSDDTKTSNVTQQRDCPLPDVPQTEPHGPKGFVNRNTENGSSATLSSTSTDFSRKYFVLDKDYMALNNLDANA